MKLKALAAAMLAALSLPSFAAIQNNDDAELVLVVWDSTASYAKDTGLTIDQLVASSSSAAGYSFTLDLSTAGGAAWTQFLGADGQLAADTRWALVAADAAIALSPTAPNDLRLLSTLSPSTVPANFLNLDWSVSQQQVGADKLISINQTGTHTPANNYAFNGESYNPVGTLAYFPPSDALGSLNFNTSLAIGGSSNLVLTTGSDEFDGFAPILATRLGNSQYLGNAAFNGTTLAYTVQAVPEPGSIAMMLAGLGALGFVGSRRRRQG